MQHDNYTCCTFNLNLRYIIEQGLRHRPVRHLILVLAGMLAVVAVNPYGAEYYRYLLQAWLMPRPLITEWGPLWQAPLAVIGIYAFSLLVIGYCIVRNGWRRLPGLLIVVVAAAAAFRHQRHLSIYAIVWACYVPSFGQTTRLGEILDQSWRARARLLRSLSLPVIIVGLAVLVSQRPWHLSVPANPDDRARVVYPVGAVDYLRASGFVGNLLTPFASGAYVSWNLYPDVMVSMDGRYEVAYPDNTMAEHVRFFTALPGWEQELARYDTHAILLENTAKVARLMPQVGGWKQVYIDDAFSIYSRSPTTLPMIDRRGERLTGTFP